MTQEQTQQQPQHEPQDELQHSLQHESKDDLKHEQQQEPQPEENRWIITPHHPIVSIIGPTASGKTALAISLARYLESKGEPAEIINQDAYQFYRGMDVGTAKPTDQEQAQVKHWLIDCYEPEESISVARFQTLARETIERLVNAHIRPILVGGSGLYARAAIDDMSFPPQNPAIRKHLEQEAEEKGPGVLFTRLQALDPQAAASMDPANVRRTIRALEVIEITKKPFSSTLPRYRYVIPTVQIGLDLSREQLDERVALRTQQMREAGFVDEVLRLQGRLGVTAHKAIGYPQIEAYLRGEISEDEAFAEITQKTQRLARKQMGWFGRDPRVHWVDSLSSDASEQIVSLVEAADRGELTADYDEVQPIRHHLGEIG